MNDLFKGDVSEDDVISRIDAREDRYELVKSVDVNGDTLLMFVLWWRTLGHKATKLVEHLLELGSDPNVVNRYGGTPLERACWGISDDALSSRELVSLMVSYGADLNISCVDGQRGGMLYRYARSGKSISAIALHGGRMTDDEYDYLIENKANGKLVEFYDNLRLSHISYAHIKRIRRQLKCVN